MNGTHTDITQRKHDVMMKGRPYKVAICEDEAMKDLIKYSGTKYDPELIQIFKKNNRRKLLNFCL